MPRTSYEGLDLERIQYFKLTPAAQHSEKEGYALHRKRKAQHATRPTRRAVHPYHPTGTNLRPCLKHGSTTHEHGGKRSSVTATHLLPWLERDGADLADVARVRLPWEVRYVHSAEGHRNPSFHTAVRRGAPRGGGPR